MTSTADLYDERGDALQSLETLLQDLDAPVELGGVAPRPSAMLPADEDGVLVER